MTFHYNNLRIAGLLVSFITFGGQSQHTIMSLSNKIWHRAPVFLKGVNLMFTTHCTMLSPGGLLACRLSHFWQTVRIRWSSLWEIWSKTQYDFLFSFQTSKECFFGREYLFCNHQKFFFKDSLALTTLCSSEICWCHKTPNDDIKTLASLFETFKVFFEIFSH